MASMASGERWVPQVAEDMGILDSQHSLPPQTLWQFLQNLDARIGHGPVAASLNKSWAPRGVFRSVLTIIFKGSRLESASVSNNS